MAEGKADEQFFQLLSGLLQQVESLTNTEEVELRSKIEALGLEVTKVPSQSSQQHLNEVEIAKELDKLSAKLDDVDEMISTAIASDPQVKTLLSGTADVWLPVITANTQERLNFTSPPPPPLHVDDDVDVDDDKLLTKDSITTNNNF